MTENIDSPVLLGDALEEAIENSEWSDEYDDVPRYDDLSDEEKAEHASLGEDFALAAALDAGEVPPVGTVIERSCEGNNKAEALGSAYITRDQIRDAGGACEVEYVGPEIIIEPHLYHTVTITITDAASEE